MDIRRYKNLVALKSTAGNIWGFHAHNLEVANLTPELWQALENSNSLAQAPEITNELESWNHEISPDTSDASDLNADDTFTIKKLSLNIAQICNLSCTYCAASGDGTYGSKVSKVDLTVAQNQIRHFLEKFIKGIPTNDLTDETQTFHIQYIGGEPLLYPTIIRELSQFARLYVAGANAKVAFSVTTNGTLITQKVAQMLADFNFSVAISIDGTAETNDATRPAKSNRQSSTVMTLKGLAELKKIENKLRALKANSVFGAHNIKIVETYNFLTSLEINWTEFNFIYANNEKDAEFSLKYIAQMNQLAEIAYAKGGLTELAKIKQFAYVLARLAAKTRIHSYCGAGKTLLQSDTRGDLYTCNWFMNDLQEKIGTNTTIESDKLAAYKKSLISLNKCETCWARHLCGGGCMAVHKAKTGDRHSKDPHFCARTQALAASAIHYYSQNLEQN